MEIETTTGMAFSFTIMVLALIALIALIFNAKGKNRIKNTEDTPLPFPDRYGFHIENTTDQDLTCVLFGCGSFLFEKNFGSADGIIVRSYMGDIPYSKFLLQSAFYPFETSLIRMSSENRGQLIQNIISVSDDISGQSATIPIFTKEYANDNDINAGFIKIPYKLGIELNSYIEIKVLARTKFIIDFYPESVFRPHRALRNTELSLFSKYKSVSNSILPRVIFKTKRDL